MPAHDRIGLDQLEDGCPSVPSEPKPDPESTITGGESSLLGLTAQDQELVTQGNILAEQIAPRFDNRTGETDHETKPVWSKSSCRFTIMEPEQAAQPFSCSYRSILFPDAVRCSGQQDHVSLSRWFLSA